LPERDKGERMIDWKWRVLGDDLGILVFELSGRLDTTSCEYFNSVLESRIQDGNEKVVIDCDTLEFVSSTGLRMLIRVHSRMKKQGGDVKLARIHGAVAKVMRIVRLDKVLHIHTTVEDAVESFAT
jgi:anti-sigma B factor antagonist